MGLAGRETKEEEKSRLKKREKRRRESCLWPDRQNASADQTATRKVGYTGRKKGKRPGGKM